MVVRRNFRWECDVNDPLAVWRDVRKPVVDAVVGDLLLIAPIGSHAPDLHSAGAGRVEVDVFAVGRVLWAVIQSRRCRQARLWPPARACPVNVEVAGALADVDNPASIR